MFDRLEDLVRRYQELMDELNAPEVVANQENFRRLMKEQNDLAPIVEAFQEYRSHQNNIQESLAMLEEESDEELRELAKQELAESKEELVRLEERLKVLLLPKDPNDEKSVIVEIRAGAGGEPILGSLPLIIFVSGYPEYAVEAFSVHAFQFLVKPISEKEFQEVFGQAVREYRCLAGKKRPAPKELLVRAGNTTRKVLAGDIYYVESSNRKVILCLGNEKITFYGRISQLERELQEQFFRVHKGYLVNMEHVERYSRTEVWMKNGDRALISKYKYQDFVKAYLKFISEGCH